MIRYLWGDGWLGRLMLVLMVLVVAGIPLMIWAAIEDDRQWSAFKAAHNCKVVGKIRGDTVTTVAPIIGGNGGVAVGVSSTPDKTGWQCADGVTYWR